MYICRGKRYYQLPIIPQVLTEARALGCSGEIQLAFFYFVKITILYNPGCSKCQTALTEAQACGYETEIIDYLNETPDVSALQSLIHKLNIKAEELVRKKETLYIEKYANQNLTEEEWLAILHEHPVLIERPIIINQTRAAIARTAESLASILT